MEKNKIAITFIAALAGLLLIGFIGIRIGKMPSNDLQGEFPVKPFESHFYYAKKTGTEKTLESAIDTFSIYFVKANADGLETKIVQSDVSPYHLYLHSLGSVSNNGTLVFATLEPNTTWPERLASLWVSRQGSAPIRILGVDHFSYGPAISADGTMIAYVRNQEYNELWTVNVDGSNNKKIIAPFEFKKGDIDYGYSEEFWTEQDKSRSLGDLRPIQWSADKNKIYFKWVNPGIDGGDPSLFSVDLKTGNIQRVTKFGFTKENKTFLMEDVGDGTGVYVVNKYSWDSPEASDFSGPAELAPGKVYRKNIRIGTSELVYEDQAHALAKYWTNGTVFGPKVSPDGKKVALLVGGLFHYGGTAVIVNLETKETVTLHLGAEKDFGNITNLAWVANDRLVFGELFGDFKYDNQLYPHAEKIYTMKIDGTEKKLIDSTEWRYEFSNDFRFFEEYNFIF